MTRQLPDAATLPRAVYSGWACVWCGSSLMNVLAERAGRARAQGRPHLDVDVYQCPRSVGCRRRGREAATQ
ncbi:hypothetical protein [Streptomyces sp. bgisy154]|uniref:hypothetical protein n=1 Tax=Streptomyces sp. bgisy154 TaxID=3413794 RepID=UPI003D751FA5